MREGSVANGLETIISTALLDSRIQGERTIAHMRLILAAVLFGALAVVFSENVRHVGLWPLVVKPPYSVELLCTLSGVGVSIIVLRIISQGRYPSWMRFVPSFVDVTCIGVTMWMFAFNDNPSLAFSGSAPWLFFIAIVVSTFRYSSASVIFTGAYAAALFLTISLSTYANMGNFIPQGNMYWSGAGKMVRLDLDDEILKCLYILAATALLTVASERLKKLLHDQIQAYAERERSVRLASAAQLANTAKSTFLANMSHELRTPLNAIIGFGRLLERSSLSGEQQANVATINRSATALLSLINDILDMSKIEAGRVELNLGPFDLRYMLDELESLFSARAREKGLWISMDVAPDVPRYALADGGKLRQVLINLLGNAVKFTNEKGVTLRVRSRNEPDGTMRLFFEVEDTGIGIPPEEIGTLFEAFVQSPRAGVHEGTGLGLAISRTFVTLMGGSISVRSELGKGSVFSFDIRARPASEGQVAHPSPRRRIKGLAPGQLTYRILVAEDRESNRELLIKLLRIWGFEVRSAKDGVECISVWEEWEPHLIFMDMRMPIMDGYEATRRIKASTRGHATVIVALTASAFDSDRKVILAEGCDDFVRKPFVEEDICKILEKHLGVAFEAEEPYQPATPAAAQPLATLPELMRSLTQGFREKLRKAALEADYSRLKELLDELRDTHPQAASALAALVRDFDYESILASLEHTGTEKT